MDESAKKILRTLQSEFPLLKELKEGLYFHGRRALRIPHESDFKALRLIPKSCPGVYVDVGANHGQSIESILLFRPEARIVSFEANPMLAEKLVRRYKGHENIRVIPTGLADKPGGFVLFVPSYKGFVYDGLASLEKTAAVSWINGKTVLGFDPNNLAIAEVPAAVETLDKYNLSPAFMKVDVQGYEYNVLRGAEETLRAFEPVLLIEDFASDQRTIQFAAKLGYDEYHFSGRSLRKGAPPAGPNSFLITPARMKTLMQSSQELS